MYFFPGSPGENSVVDDESAELEDLLSVRGHLADPADSERNPSENIAEMCPWQQEIVEIQ
eukprot:719547-Hanusia_phi.AAC.1